MKSTKILDCILILVVGCLPLLFFFPFQNTPFIDDWVYAWSVKELLAQGHLSILEYSAHPNVIQILWGALFCLPAGFSFTALRISSWTLALASLCGFYLLIREFDIPRRNALIGTATFGTYPIFFMLSFTFMTDIPFVAFMILSSFAMVRCLRLRNTGWLSAASVLACLAAGTRAIAVFIPCAMAISLVLHSGNWGRSTLRILISLAPVAALAFFLWYTRNHLFYSADLNWIQGMFGNRITNLKYGLSMLPESLVANLGFVAGTLGIALLPVSMAVSTRQNLLRTAIIFAGLSVILSAGYFAGISYVLPLEPGQTWALIELGATEPLVPGWEPAIPVWLSWIAFISGGWSFAVFTALCLRRRFLPGEAFLIWSLFGYFLLMSLLWLFYDRYALVLVPGSVILLLTGRPPLRGPVAISLAALFYIVSIVGVKDHLDYNKALWAAVDDLHRIGAADSEINGGYLVNGWLQYAHPEHAHRDDKNNMQIPWINADNDYTLRYCISNRVLAGWSVLKELPYHRWLGRSGSLYILMRSE